ncbi:MAG: SiaC family regulatory phosphoprotein [Bacteroidales bacterium]
MAYFNSSASKMIMQMIATLKEVKNKGKELNIEWYYMEDDDDMLDTGKTFEELTELEFEYFCY